ncbi:MAG: DUF1576 domain-containing protein [Dethiobacteraceae bacterium]
MGFALAEDKTKDLVVVFYLLFLITVGLFLQTPQEIFYGLKEIFIAPGMLITDYMVVGGIGAALVNGALVGLIGFVLLKINKIDLNGISIAAIFTMVGFALFGKNIWSVLPLIFGVYIYSRVMGKAFKTYIYSALFGTALAPLVTQAAFGYGWGVAAGIVVGVVAGFVIAPLANHLLKAHAGYNIYNIGFTAGFVGMLFLNIFRTFGYNSEIVVIWGTEFNSTLRWIFLPMFVSMLLLGVILGRDRRKDYREILKQSGTLITDFVALGGFANTLVNMGIVGLMGSAYLELVGGHYNGATVGGLLTMVGFAACGKHPVNIAPIMLGIWLGTSSKIQPLSVLQASAPGPLLAALFGTTLAPLAGRFGPLVGIIAGFVHLSIVSNVGILHGGLNLYNNGFSGGLVATIFVAVINGLQKEK